MFSLRGLSPCASALRLWCCRLREKRSCRSEGRVSVFWTILNLLGQVTRRQQSLEKTQGFNLQNKERRTPGSFSLAWARRCTYLRAIASVNARILGLWSHAICHSGFIHCSHATRWGRNEQPHVPEPTKTSYEKWKQDELSRSGSQSR